VCIINARTTNVARIILAKSKGKDSFSRRRWWKKIRARRRSHRDQGVSLSMSKVQHARAWMTLSNVWAVTYGELRAITQVPSYLMAGHSSGNVQINTFVSSGRTEMNHKVNDTIIGRGRWSLIRRTSQLSCFQKQKQPEFSPELRKESTNPRIKILC
jgi:hypothetical protein